MNNAELLDKAKEVTGATSDYKLAQVLDIPKERISDYRNGKRKPDVYACARIAAAINRDPLEIIALVEAEAAKSETQRAFWRSFKFSGIRGSFGLMLCGMWAFFGAGQPIGNAEAGMQVNSYNGGFRNMLRRIAQRRSVARSDDRRRLTLN